MPQKFSDNARALLNSSITAFATSLTVEAAKADRFPIANTTDWFKAVLIDSSGNREVIRVNTRTLGSGVFGNVVRAQDGTTALSFTAGALVICPITAADIQAALTGSFAALASSTTLDVAGKMKQGAVEGRFVPVGGIIMWSGSVAAIPAGWQLADGTNGSPDLRNRFVIGAGSTYGVAATGGSKDAVVVAHTHGVNITSGGQSANHVHALNDPGHVHVQLWKSTIGGDNSGGDPNSIVNTTVNTGSAVTGITMDGTSVDHNHLVNGTTASTGASGTNANLPPYYALAYIFCLAQA